MNGQLWEPCPRCHTEPVCAMCGYCARHCVCTQLREDRQQIAEFEATNPGMLAELERFWEEAREER